jgi:hypothetical protein
MPKKSVLHLNLKREYFAEIASKKKRTEFRAYTPYWKSRLASRDYDVICFRNGYSKKAPEMLVQFLGVRRAGTGRNAHFAIRANVPFVICTRLFCGASRWP